MNNLSKGVLYPFLQKYDFSLIKFIFMVFHLGRNILLLYLTGIRISYPYRDQEDGSV